MSKKLPIWSPCNWGGLGRVREDQDVPPNKSRSCVGRGQVSGNRLQNTNSALTINQKLVLTITIQCNGSCFQNGVWLVLHNMV